MESYAIRDGIQLAIDLGYTRIYVESDAKEMVSMCNSEFSEGSAVADVCHEIKELLGGFTSCALIRLQRIYNF